MTTLEFVVNGFYYYEDLEMVLTHLFGFVPEYTTETNLITLTFEEPLDPLGLERLEEHLAKKPQYTPEQLATRQAKAAGGYNILQGNVLSVALSAQGESINNLSSEQVEALLMVLLRKAGGITNDMKVAQLSDWVRQ